MNIKRFIRLLNEEQSDWHVNHINHNAITKTATLNVNHIGADPGKIRTLLKGDERFIRKQAAVLIKLSQKHGPKVVPKFKRVNIVVV